MNYRYIICSVWFSECPVQVQAFSIIDIMLYLQSTWAPPCFHCLVCWKPGCPVIRIFASLYGAFICCACACACWIIIRSNLIMLSGSLVACLGAFTSSWRTSGSSWLAATSVHSHCYLSIIPLVGGTVQFSAGIFNHIYMVFIIVLFLIAVLVVNNDSMQA